MKPGFIRIGADGNILSDNAGFVDRVGYGRGEHGIAAGDLVMLLQQHREGQTVLFDFGAVFLWIASAYHRSSSGRSR